MSEQLYQGERGKWYFESKRRLYNYPEGMYRRIWDGLVMPADSVLDFGCGNGSLLARLPAQKKIGIEINPVARQRAVERGLVVFDKLSDLPTTRFSKIVSSHTLEHVSSPVAVLMELKNFLEPQTGSLILLLPLEDVRSRAERTWRANDVNMHLYGWTPKLLGNLLWCAGFQPRQIEIIRCMHPPRGSGELLWRLNPHAYFAAAGIWAIARGLRQIRAIAEWRA